MTCSGVLQVSIECETRARRAKGGLHGSLDPTDREGCSRLEWDDRKSEERM